MQKVEREAMFFRKRTRAEFVALSRRMNGPNLLQKIIFLFDRMKEKNSCSIFLDISYRPNQRVGCVNSHTSISVKRILSSAVVFLFDQVMQDLFLGVARRDIFSCF